MKQPLHSWTCWISACAGLLFNVWIILPANAQGDSLAVRSAWGYNTAYLMTPHKWESGIAQPFRYGINQKFEVRSNVLEMPFFPNAAIKIAWGNRQRWVFASEHLVSYPTVFLNTVSMKGTGGLISPEFAPFPAIVSIMNSMFATKPIGKSSLLTGFVRYTFAIRNGRADPQATIDLPLVYPRSAHWYEGSTIRVGTHFKGELMKRLYYEEGVEWFFVTRPANNFFFENTGALMWSATRWLRIRGGYSLSYGVYPYGIQWQLWPAFDLVFGSKTR